MNLIEKFKNREVKAKDLFTIKSINKNTAHNFVGLYHYLGDTKFFSVYNYGLFIDDELVGVATYSRPQGDVALKSWFGITDNKCNYIYELSRLCTHPNLNGTNATSYLLGNSMKLLKKEGVKAVITLADASRHCGSIYQVCNFRYYGMTEPKNDFWWEENGGSIKTRGKTRGVEGVWLPRTRKHRYCYLLDKSLEVKLSVITKLPQKNVVYIPECCHNTNIVYDRRFDQQYTCPKCTGKLKKVNESKGGKNE